MLNTSLFRILKFMLIFCFQYIFRCFSSASDCRFISVSYRNIFSSIIHLLNESSSASSSRKTLVVQFSLTKKSVFNQRSNNYQLEFLHERGERYSMVLLGVECTVLDWTASVIFAVSDRVKNANDNGWLRCSYFSFVCVHALQKAKRERKIIPLKYQNVVFSLYERLFLRFGMYVCRSWQVKKSYY